MRLSIGQRIITTGGRRQGFAAADEAPIGSYGWITGYDCPLKGTIYDYYLKLDCKPGVQFAAIKEAVEPVGDHNEKSSWSDCAWKPKEIHGQA